MVPWGWIARTVIIFWLSDSPPCHKIHFYKNDKAPQFTFTQWNILIVYISIHGPQRINPDDFGDPLTFLSVPPSSWQLLLFLSEKSSESLDRMTRNWVHVFMVPSGWTLTTVVILWLVFWLHHLVDNLCYFCIKKMDWHSCYTHIHNPQMINHEACRISGIYDH